jgi:hypothetical protein
MSQPYVMITGGDGISAAAGAANYLEHTAAPVLLWVHAGDAQQCAMKRSGCDNS